MTLNEFLKYVETRKPLKGDEIHQFMNKMSDEARRMTFELNGSYHDPEEIRELLSRLFNKPVDPSFRVFPPFYTDFGKNITVGKNVFINACCHFQDHGGVTLDDGEKTQVTGCSVGGGRIKITDIDGLAANIRAEAPTLLITQNDKPGVVGAVSGLLAESGLNIAVMRVSRVAKGDIANCVIETDGRIGGELVRRIRQLPNVRSVRAINI